jgi:hypothetical protein
MKDRKTEITEEEWRNWCDLARRGYRVRLNCKSGEVQIEGEIPMQSEYQESKELS